MSKVENLPEKTAHPNFQKRDKAPCLLFDFRVQRARPRRRRFSLRIAMLEGPVWLHAGSGRAPRARAHVAKRELKGALLSS